MKDILYNDLGAWKHNGSSLKYIIVDKYSENNDLKPRKTKDPGCYIIKHYEDISSPDLTKRIAKISGI